MAPIKIEDNIREKLEERELQPSADAWQKLEGMLGEQEKKRRPFVLWYAIAASIIGVLLVTTFFFRGNETGVDTIVNEDKNNSQILKDDVLTSEILQKEQIVVQETEENVTNEDPINEVQEITENSGTIKKDKVTESRSIQKQLASADKDNNNPKSEKNTVQNAIQKASTKNIIISEKMALNELQKGIQVIDKEEQFIAAKVDNVVSKIEQLKENNKNVTEAEIDALLVAAQQEIAMQRILNETQVDAMALLDDVEYEMDERSFKDKVFYALGEGFEYIKTAVVDRNN